MTAATWKKAYFSKILQMINMNKKWRNLSQKLIAPISTLSMRRKIFSKKKRGMKLSRRPISHLSTTMTIKNSCKWPKLVIVP
jgi:hypothetical protein